MKRLFSIIVVLVMFVSLFPSAMAEEESIDALKKRIEELETQIAEKDSLIEELKAKIEKNSKANEDDNEKSSDVTDYEIQTIESDSGKLEIKGYSFTPNGYKDGKSIFTVHATLTIKGSEPKCSWQTFHTQAYQEGIDTKRHTDFSKSVLLTTDILPDTPVDIDYDFLVESKTAPITFIIQTWGKSITLFSEVVEIDGTNATPKK